MGSFFDAVRARRSCYAIGKDPLITEDGIRQIVNEAIMHSPSAFNSQSARVVVLMGKEHERLWDLVKAELKKIVPADKFQATEDKINGAFRSGHGTVLYFEDMSVIQGLQKQFPPYKDAFPAFSDHSAGMLQYIIWTAFAEAGIGATLQHYNPVIDDAVKAAWHIPENWKFLAQMPFGKPLAAPGKKEFQPIEGRVKFY